MHIMFDIRWLAGRTSPEEIDPTLFRLLEAVRVEGSLVRAAESAAVSYRHAWGLLRRWENRFHLPLVEMRRGRGHGARLSELGDRLLLARDSMRARLDIELKDLSEDLNREIRELGRSRVDRVVRVAASHGMAIAHLVELLRSDMKLDVRLQTRGSIESLRLLSRAECSMAGFHFPEGRIRKSVAPLYQPWLGKGKVTLLLVAMRRQGLMTRPGDADKITGLADLAKHSVRFVNRQVDSGTRTIFDGLLREAGISRGRINGYEREEFTHLAVAAMVASGAADAGFGIEAAAAELGLRFVPVLSEGYYLAIPRDAGELKDLVARTLRSGAFRRRLRAIPGYDAASAGTELNLSEILSST